MNYFLRVLERLIVYALVLMFSTCFWVLVYKIVRRIIVKLFFCLVLMVAFSGCSSLYKSAWPVKKMVDPVTKEVPSVIYPK